MNVLDENILKDQRQLLLDWRISVRQIGFNVGRKGIQDEEIIPLLLQLQRPTFFTLDKGFYKYTFCHERYCIVCLEVGDNHAAQFVKRFLRQPSFNTAAKRMGTVIRVSHVGLSVWRFHSEKKAHVEWAD